MSHPCVKEAGVCGMDDDTWGQVPIAFIVQKSEVSKEELLEYCQNKMAKYKVPKDVHFVEQLPRNASNKLMRRNLKELLK